jgi:hypothetical protein
MNFICTWYHSFTNEKLLSLLLNLPTPDSIYYGYELRNDNTLEPKAYYGSLKVAQWDNMFQQLNQDTRRRLTQEDDEPETEEETEVESEAETPEIYPQSPEIIPSPEF